MADYDYDDYEYDEDESESPLRYDSDTGQSWSALQDDYCLPAPSHSPELERLAFLHDAYKWTIGNTNETIRDFLGDNRCKILDAGTGTGVWAVEMAQDYPNCQVFGVDLVDCPVAIPPSNCTFIVKDIQFGLPYEDDYFDFVHVRDMSLGFHDYNAMLQECIRTLKPGGYILIREAEYDVKEEDGNEDDPFPDMQRFFQVFREALEERRLDPWVGWTLQERIYAFGDLWDQSYARFWVPFAPYSEDYDEYQAGLASRNAFNLFPEATQVMMLEHGERETYKIGADALQELEDEANNEPIWWFGSAQARKVGTYEPPEDEDDDNDDDNEDDDDDDGGSTATEGSTGTA